MSFVIGWKDTIFEINACDVIYVVVADYTIMSRTPKVTDNHVVYGRGA